MKELVRQHFGSIVIAAAILLAVFIYALTTRYAPATAGGFAYVLTACVTILLGALTVVVGQIIIRGAIEPALELKRLIGTIANDLDFYANRFDPGTPDEQEWRDVFRKHSCSLREKLNVIIAYPIFEYVLRLPPEKEVRAAAANLLGYSNRPSQPSHGFQGLQDAEIKKLLRIKT